MLDASLPAAVEHLEGELEVETVGVQLRHTIRHAVVAEPSLPALRALIRNTRLCCSRTKSDQAPCVDTTALLIRQLRQRLQSLGHREMGREKCGGGHELGRVGSLTTESSCLEDIMNFRGSFG